MSFRSRSLALGGLTLILLGLAAYEIASRRERSDPPENRLDRSSPADGRTGTADRANRTDQPASPTDDRAILEAFDKQRSGVEVGSTGTIVQLLPDDLKGSRHQRFIVRLEGGHTLLVSHNIDLAPRVPIDEGDSIEFRGRYEWNHRGGVVHWTHHDPDGRSPGGWLIHAGRRYD